MKKKEKEVLCAGVKSEALQPNIFVSVYDWAYDYICSSQAVTSGRVSLLYPESHLTNSLSPFLLENEISTKQMKSGCDV